MSSTDYRVAVGAHGLPLRVRTRKARGNEALTGLTGEEVCKIFWQLEGLEVRYKVRVGGVLVDKFIQLKAESKGVERLVKQPKFEGEGVSFSPINVFEQNDGRYSMAMKINYVDRVNGIGIHLKPHVERELHYKGSRKSDFMGTQVELGVWSKDEEVGVEILEFWVRPK